VTPVAAPVPHIEPSLSLGRNTALDFLSLLKEGDSYGSRCRDFCFIADCPVREDSR
jgi:hypothetical protein